MVLKAMDDSGRGDVFGMACAILQSINSKAKLINISAGYYGKADSVLIILCTSQGSKYPHYRCRRQLAARQ